MNKSIVKKIACIVALLLFIGSLILLYLNDFSQTFEVITGICAIILVITIAMVWRDKLLAQKEKNFTCPKCGVKFKWDKEKIVCELLNKSKSLRDDDAIIITYKIKVKWICDCGEVIEFEKKLTTKNEDIDSMELLIERYYNGEQVS